MKNYKRTPEKLYDATNQGLDILFKYLPDCVGCEVSQNIKFKYREENTPSATLKEVNNVWLVVDYGGSTLNPIQVVMDKLGLEFPKALEHLYDEFHLDDNSNSSYTPILEVKENHGKAEDYFKITLKKEPKNLNKVARFLEKEIADDYYFYEVESYEWVTLSGKFIRKEATENYPIFCYSPNLDEWAKIYCPNDTKGFKHSYIGKKPTTYMHGLDRILNKVSLESIIDLEKQISSSDGELKKELEAYLKEEKLPNIVIVSGGSDGLSLASLSNEFYPVWFNSEGEQITYEMYQKLKKLCINLYNIPDIDKAGINYAYSLQKKYWQLKTIWLPREKMTKNGKDFRDFLNFYARADKNTILRSFKNYVNVALKLDFIDNFGNPTRPSYKINLSNLHYFLKVHNYHAYKPQRKMTDRTNDDITLFVKIENNVVSIPTAGEVRNFCEKYYLEKGQNLQKVNLIKSSRNFSDTELRLLNRKKLNFVNFSRDNQTFFFKNKAVLITGNTIELLENERNDCYVWKEKVINHNFLVEKPFFEYYTDEKGNDRVKILRTDCDFMTYIINSSRIYWKNEFTTNEERKEFQKKYGFPISSDKLLENEKIVQERHFLNKCFAIGYMLHRYKQDDYAKFVYIMDDVVNEGDEESHGGTGKSLTIEAIKKIINVFSLDGKNDSIRTDRHTFGAVTEDDDLIFLDDGSKYLDFDFFYSKITGSLMVNPKQRQGFEIPFEKSPKFAGTFNYGIKKLEGSDTRRIMFVSYSDYYHSVSENNEKEHKPRYDFGKGFFREEWNEKDFNLFYNYMLQCLSFYLRYKDSKEFTAPDDNIVVTNLKRAMGDTFLEWAESYFQEDKFNNLILKSDIYEDYKNIAGRGALSIKNFKKAIKDFCKLNGYTFNPKSKQNSQGRVLTTIYLGEKRSTAEAFYIENLKVEDNTTTNDNIDDNTDDIAF